MLATIYALSLPSGALATPGDLDPNFASHGIYPGAPPTTGGLDGTPIGTAATADGGAVLLRDGPSELVRFTRAGQLDPTFADDGVLRFPDGFDATGLALDDQGRAVVSGSSASDPDIVATRATAAGAIDPTFGDGGYASLDLGKYPGSAEGVVIAPTGAVALGMAYDPGGYDDEMFVAKLHDDGSPDLAFGNDGVSRPVPDTPATLMVDPVGGFLVGGVDGYGFTASIGHFDSSGRLDRSYGEDGLATPPLYGGEYGGVGTFAVDQAGGVVVALDTFDEHGEYQYLVRVGPDGGNDETFNDNVVASGSNRGLRISSLTVEPSGDILVAGESSAVYPNFDPVLARIAPDGGPDPSFGIDGRSAFPAGGVGTAGFSLPVGEPDGSIFLAGADKAYRLLDGPGSDADADSFSDSADECPRFPDYRPNGIGCPDVAIALTLTYRKGIGFKGGVTAPFGCLVLSRSNAGRRDARVRIVRVRSGEDRVIATVRVNKFTHAFQLKKQPAPGRFYAEYRERVVPSAGRCLGSRSAHVTIR